MPYKILRPHRIHPPTLLILRPAQHLDAHKQLPPHMLHLAKAHRDPAEQERPLTRHSHFEREPLVLDPRPLLVHGARLDVRVPQPVVVVRRVLVEDPTLHLEPGWRDVGYDPLDVPFWVHGFADGGRAQGERGVDLMALGQRGGDLGDDEGVGGEGVDVCERQICGAVERYLDRTSWRGMRDRRVIEAAGGAFLLARAIAVGFAWVREGRRPVVGVRVGGLFFI